jgi:hypothetical protein
MLLSTLWYFLFLGFLGGIKSFSLDDLEIMGVEPNAGPSYGETKVLVRFKDFDPSIIEDYPRPRVKINLIYILVSLWKPQKFRQRHLRKMYSTA